MSEPVRSRLSLVTALCLVGYALCCLLLWTARDWRPEWDGAVYVLVAKSLAAGEGYLYQGEPFFLRPPGLPWALSFIVGGEGFDPYPVNLLLMAFAATTVAALLFALRGLHDGAFALLVALLAGTSLIFGELFNSIFAEFPFATFTFVAIALLERSRRAGARWWIPAAVGGASLAAAILMRTVALLLLPGVFLLPLTLSRGPARWRGVLPLIVALALTFPWFQYSRAAAAAAEVPVEQDLLYDYTTALFHVDPGDPGSPRVDFDGWRTRIADNGSALLTDLAEATLHVPASLPVALLFLAALAVGVVATVRERGPTLFEWLGLVYVPLIATYFVYDVRLVMPLVPLVYLYLLAAVRRIVAVAMPERAQRTTAVAAGLLLVANIAFLSRALSQRSHTGGIREDMARAVRQHTPPDARIYCNQAPIVALMTDRRTFTYRFRRSPDPLAKYGIDHVLYDTFDTPQALRQVVQQRQVEAWPIPLRDGRQTRLIRIR